MYDLAKNQLQEDPQEVSLTNSKVERVMNHHHRKVLLQHHEFSEHELNTLNSVDAHLGVARSGLEGVANHMSTSLKVCV